MNIFVLDMDPIQSAKYHCDTHVIKMPTEVAQILNTNSILLGGDSYKRDYEPFGKYKVSHANHPITKWARETLSNFEWAAIYGLALCKEYTFRYGKIHKCEEIIQWFSEIPSLVPVGEMTPFAKCMPDQYKSKDIINSYRTYYKKEKRDIAKWTKRQVPEWWE